MVLTLRVSCLMRRLGQTPCHNRPAFGLWQAARYHDRLAHSQGHFLRSLAAFGVSASRTPHELPSAAPRAIQTVCRLLPGQSTKQTVGAPSVAWASFAYWPANPKPSPGLRALILYDVLPKPDSRLIAQPHSLKPSPMGKCKHL